MARKVAGDYSGDPRLPQKMRQAPSNDTGFYAILTTADHL
jgi:hypothetical protein